MSERPVEIPVSKKLRDRIKILKRELTYEEFFVNLIKKNGEVVASPTAKTRPKMTTSF